MYDFFEKFYEELTQQITGLVYGEANKAEYAALSNDAETVREIADLFKAALETGRSAEMNESDLDRQYAELEEAGSAIDEGDTGRNKRFSEHENLRFSVNRTDLTTLLAENDNASSITEQIARFDSSLNRMDVVSVVPLLEGTADRVNKQVRTQIAKSPRYISVQGLGDVEFGLDLVNEVFKYLNTNEERSAILAIPNVLKRGILVGAHRNHKYRGYKTLTIGGPVKIGGTRYNMGVVVRETKGLRYDMHRILLPNGAVIEISEEKTEATNAVRPSVNGFPATAITSVEVSISDPAAESNPSVEHSEETFYNDLVNGGGEPRMSMKSGGWESYVTPEAQTQYEQDARFKRWTHRDLAFISAASWDGVHIPADVLMQNPKIQEAQRLTETPESSFAKNPPGANRLVDENRARLAKRLQDDKHGSAVFENGKIKKIDGVEQFTGEVEQGRHACIVIGRPAGGKSRVFANPLSNRYKARIMDSDVVKPWLDGFNDGYGAGYVQDESAYIMETAFKEAVKRGDNIIIPKIGGGSIVDLAETMKLAGYTVDLYYNEVSEETSIMRAASRFAEEGRYLDLGYLRSIGEKATRTFTKYAESGIFNYAEWRNNDVGFGEEPKLIWHTGRGRLASVLGDAAELERAVGRNASAAQRSGQKEPDFSENARGTESGATSEELNNDASKAPDDGAFFDALVGNDKPKYSAKSHGGGSFYDTLVGNDRRAEYDAQQREILAEDSEWEGEGRAASLATSEKVFRNLAKSILQKASSRYSVDSFTDDLKALFHMVGDQARTETQRIARKVLNQSSERDDTMYDATYDARRYFRRGRFALSEKQKREAAIAYDGYNNYRRSLMGKLNIAKDGILLDDAWDEICEMFPGYFDADTAEGDQPKEVKEFLDAAYERPYINPYGTRYNMDDAASELADELLAAFSNIRQRKPAESQPDKEGEPDKERKTPEKAPSEKAGFSFERPTTRQGRLQKAWELYDNNMNPQKYYEQSAEKTRQLREMKLFNDGKTSEEMFDLKTNNLLRGLMLRNGENVGGALADNSMQRVTEIFSRAKKRLAIPSAASALELFRRRLLFLHEQQPDCHDHGEDQQIPSCTHAMRDRRRIDHECRADHGGDGHDKALENRHFLFPLHEHHKDGQIHCVDRNDRKLRGIKRDRTEPRVLHQISAKEIGQPDGAQHHAHNG